MDYNFGGNDDDAPTFNNHCVSIALVRTVLRSVNGPLVFFLCICWSYRWLEEMPCEDVAAWYQASLKNAKSI